MKMRRLVPASPDLGRAKAKTLTTAVMRVKRIQRIIERSLNPLR